MTVTTEEAANLMDVSAVTVRQWVRKGWLKPVPRLDPTRRQHWFFVEDVVRCELAHRSNGRRANFKRAQAEWRAALADA